MTFILRINSNEERLKTFSTRLGVEYSYDDAALLKGADYVLEQNHMILKLLPNAFVHIYKIIIALYQSWQDCLLIILNSNLKLISQ